MDAYLSNPQFYPVGMFDDTFDGNGDPMHNTPFFRQDLAAPFGSEGAIARLDNFNNLVYTGLFDQTTLTTPGGRAFLRKLGGPAGDEIADDYVKVLAATNVTGYPFVKASSHPQPGSEDAPLGLRVDNQKLLDLNAYVVNLPAPLIFKYGRALALTVPRGRHTQRNYVLTRRSKWRRLRALKCLNLLLAECLLLHAWDHHLKRISPSRPPASPRTQHSLADPYRLTARAD